MIILQCLNIGTFGINRIYTECLNCLLLFTFEKFLTFSFSWTTGPMFNEEDSIITKEHRGPENIKRISERKTVLQLMFRTNGMWWNNKHDAKQKMFWENCVNPSHKVGIRSVCLASCFHMSQTCVLEKLWNLWLCKNCFMVYNKIIELLRL